MFASLPCHASFLPRPSTRSAMYHAFAVLLCKRREVECERAILASGAGSGHSHISACCGAPPDAVPSEPRRGCPPPLPRFAHPGPGMTEASAAAQRRVRLASAAELVGAVRVRRSMQQRAAVGGARPLGAAAEAWRRGNAAAPRSRCRCRRLGGGGARGIGCGIVPFSRVSLDALRLPPAALRLGAAASAPLR
jgi:hypothetical protein